MTSLNKNATSAVAANSSSHPKYRPDIDGLRAIAVLSVVGFHAFPYWIPGGFIGVDVFFVISGFLISTIIYKGLEAGTFSFADFYARRIRRIFPALVLVLLASLCFGWFALLADEYTQLGKHVAAGAGFVANLVFWSEAGYFDSSAETKPLLHLWSLGIEEQFYILWPLLLWLGWKCKLNLGLITVALAAASFALNVHGLQADPVATFFSPQTRFWELLCGGLLAWATLYKPGIYDYVGRLQATVLGLLGLGLLASGFWIIHQDFGFPGAWALLPVAGTVMTIVAGPDAWPNKALLSNRVAVWIGLISYPLYLWHWPLLTFARIVEDGVPDRNLRIAAVLLSIALAWLTVRLVEQPLRFSKSHSRLKIAGLCCTLAAVGAAGVLTSRADFTQTHSYEKLAIQRKGFEHAFGFSLAWYRGKEDWLYLGNAYHDTVAKQKLAKIPSIEEVNATKALFQNMAAAGHKLGVPVALIVGPNKASIYPEYLPNELKVSARRYVDFFLDALKDVPNLTAYDPTEDLARLKASEGLLYWMTDTHWNEKGAYFAYSGLARHLGLPAPEVSFKPGPTRSGDLIEIAKLQNFPLHAEDNWQVVWEVKPEWTEEAIPNEPETPFGPATIVRNPNALTDKRVWVVGDSFTTGLRPYLNASFKEVQYLGHWAQKLQGLPDVLLHAEQKPDLVLIIRVERTF